MFQRPGYARRRSSLDKEDKQRKRYPDIAAEVINISDIVIEVLDARFIDETRNKAVEELIKNKEKKIIYAINKIDLTDIGKVRAIIAEQKLYPHVLVSCKTRRGIRILRNTIKIEAGKADNRYSRKQVGIIGYPEYIKNAQDSVIRLIQGAKQANVYAFLEKHQIQTPVDLGLKEPKKKKWKTK